MKKSLMTPKEYEMETKEYLICMTYAVAHRLKKKNSTISPDYFNENFWTVLLAELDMEEINRLAWEICDQKLYSEERPSYDSKELEKVHGSWKDIVYNNLFEETNEADREIFSQVDIIDTL